MRVTLTFILLIQLIVQSLPAPQVDLYAFLGVPPTATESEINKAYRQTALKLHPGTCLYKRIYIR
jgi:preprotein translocase subunit Sec63